MKIKVPSLKTIGYLLFFIYCFFSDLFDAVLGTGFRLGIFILSLVCLFIGSKARLVVTKSNVIVIILVLTMVLINNQGIKNGTYMPMVNFLVYLMIAIFIKNSPECYGSMMKIIMRLGFIHVLATFFFLIFPSLYSVINRIWSRPAGGTVNGRYGYRAALSDHYSGNGIMIAITYIAIFAFILALSNTNMKAKRRALMALFVLALFAVVLTTKRAHLLFGLAAIIFVYYFCNPEKMNSRTFKLILILAVLVVFLLIFADDLPYIGDILRRFEEMDEDTHMMSRYRLWEHAFEMFARSPIIGNGWMSFRLEFAQYLARAREGSNTYMNAHNIYIQLLAEVGIVGTLLFVLIVAFLLFTAFKLLRAYNKKQFETKLSMEPLYFASMFLVFFLMYGMTGNCLYDKTQPYFFVICGMIMGYKDQYILLLKQRRAEEYVGRALPEKI